MQLIRVSADSPPEMFDKLSQLCRQCLGSEGWSAESFRSECEKPGGTVLCIVDGDNIAAVIAGSASYDTADIYCVACAPEYRRRGLAMQLMDGFEQLLPPDTECILLEVRVHNAPAQELYVRCGFERISVRKRFYSDPVEDAYLMRKEIVK
ncbi:MAG: ribosomal protein S18-alanine N-acetyltransferase [Ruminococcus sp.]|nr:ribosomal protein S18-alanine N-acetyltransferase [Ruminococcus sp.]